MVAITFFMRATVKIVVSTLCDGKALDGNRDAGAYQFAASIS